MMHLSLECHREKVLERATPELLLHGLQEPRGAEESNASSFRVIDVRRETHVSSVTTMTRRRREVGGRREVVETEEVREWLPRAQVEQNELRELCPNFRRK